VVDGVDEAGVVDVTVVVVACCAVACFVALPLVRHGLVQVVVAVEADLPWLNVVVAHGPYALEEAAAAAAAAAHYRNVLEEAVVDRPSWLLEEVAVDYQHVLEVYA
jgi:hypothetical protein